jgi:hypothetical protein
MALQLDPPQPAPQEALALAAAKPARPLLPPLLLL